jgi:mRNA interferase YafQ
MARELLTTNAFERDLRKVEKQGKELDKLEAIVDLLQADKPLPVRCRVHPLGGAWEHHWDCHIEPGWLLLYRLPPGKLVLVRTGSHSELFR